MIDFGGNILVEDARDFGTLEEYERAGIWREALWDLVASLPSLIRTQLSDIAVDGTSGTVLACDETLAPRHPPLLYNDDRAVEEAALIAKTAVPGHPAAAVTSGLAKTLWLKKRFGLTGTRLYLNQADWLSGLLTDRIGMTDYHNALKMGLDLDTLQWPAWVKYLADVNYLPEPIAPGARLATVSRPRARYLGINPRCMVHAGTTDSIAAFLAAGVSQSGDAVTSLGSTLVLKLLSDTRVESSEHGVYSHWFGERWLAGGASNAGGAVLRQFFDDRTLACGSFSTTAPWLSSAKKSILPSPARSTICRYRNPANASRSTIRNLRRA